MRRYLAIPLLACLANTCIANGILSPAQKAVVILCLETKKASWEGDFVFSDDQSLRTIEIEGQETLYIVPYRRGVGTVIDAFRVKEDLSVESVYEGQPNKMGNTPSLESLVVLPNEADSEIVITWRYPGQGGILRIQKFIWDGKRLTLSQESSYGGRHDSIWRLHQDDAPEQPLRTR